MNDKVPALEAHRLSAAYHQHPVLEDVTLVLPQGGGPPSWAPMGPANRVCSSW